MSELLTGGNRGLHQSNSALQRSVQCPAPSAQLVLAEQALCPLALSGDATFSTVCTNTMITSYR